MGELDKLNWVAATRTSHLNPQQQRRQKLAAKIDEQIQLTAAKMNGEPYAPTRRKKIVNPATGETTQIDAPRRIKAWWWTGDNGRLLLTIRYGAKVLEWSKHKNAIELSDLSAVVDALTLIKQAVLQGELDAQITAASGQCRKGFNKGAKNAHV
jgi:hypothetical protein